MRRAHGGHRGALWALCLLVAAAALPSAQARALAATARRIAAFSRPSGTPTSDPTAQPTVSPSPTRAGASPTTWVKYSAEVT